MLLGLSIMIVIGMLVIIGALIIGALNFQFGFIVVDETQLIKTSITQLISWLIILIVIGAFMVIYSIVWLLVFYEDTKEVKTN